MLNPPALQLQESSSKRKPRSASPDREYIPSSQSSDGSVKILSDDDYIFKEDKKRLFTSTVCFCHEKLALTAKFFDFCNTTGPGVLHPIKRQKAELTEAVGKRAPLMEANSDTDPNGRVNRLFQELYRSFGECAPELLNSFHDPVRNGIVNIVAA